MFVCLGFFNCLSPPPQKKMKIETVTKTMRFTSLSFQEKKQGFWGALRGFEELAHQRTQSAWTPIKKTRKMEDNAGLRMVYFTKMWIHLEKGRGLHFLRYPCAHGFSQYESDGNPTTRPSVRPSSVRSSDIMCVPSTVRPSVRPLPPRTRASVRPPRGGA